MIETRTAKININKTGGTSTGYNGKLTIPKTWLDKLKIDAENREVKITLKKDEIIIKKT